MTDIYSDMTKYMACSDFGFDPLGLATVPANFERFKESEIYHCP